MISQKRDIAFDILSDAEINAVIERVCNIQRSILTDAQLDEILYREACKKIGKSAEQSMK